MKTLLLVIALAAKAEAPKAGLLHEVTAATAAVASAQVFPGGIAARPAEAADRHPLAGVAADNGAEAQVPLVAAATASRAAEAKPPAALAATAPVAKSAAPWVNVFPTSNVGSDCSLVDIYAKRRFLSGPWSAARRLRAARLRGDEDEAKRMEAALADLVIEAVETEAERR